MKTKCKGFKGTAPAREGEQAIDPVCGMIVNKETAASSTAYSVQTDFFCSDHCLEQFRTNPGRFLRDSKPQAGEESQPGAAADAEYTCPIHPQIVRDKPGNCPICGMTLEPRTVSLEDEERFEGAHL